MMMMMISKLCASFIKKINDIIIQLDNTMAFSMGCAGYSNKDSDIFREQGIRYKIEWLLILRH